MKKCRFKAVDRGLCIKNKNTYKVVIAFNVTETNKNGKYKFPTQKQCAYVSGDITVDDLGRVLVTVEKVLRTNNIQIV